MSFAVVPVATTSDPNTSRFPSRSTSPPNGGVMALMNLPDLCLAGGQHSIGISSPTQNTVFLDPTPSSLQYPASCRSQSCYIPTPATATMPATPKSGSSLNVHTEAKLEKSPCLFEIEESDDSEIANLATRTHSGLAVTTGLRSTASWLSGGPSTTALDSARRSAVLSSNDGRFSAPTIRRAPFTLTTSSSQHRGATPAIAKQLNFDSSANVSSRSQPAMDHTPEARVSSAGSTSGVAPANYSWAGAAMLIEA